MTIRALWLMVVLCAACNTSTASTGPGAHARASISPEDAADMIHRVIEADRATYAEHVVNRLQNDEKVIQASEQFKEEKALPLPSQMLRMSATAAASKGNVRWALISKWAINKVNMPKSEFEKRGLEALAADPGRPYRSYETVGGKRYFMALYPDNAVSMACVNCHNNHEESPRSDFKQGETMGGVVVSIALE